MQPYPAVPPDPSPQSKATLMLRKCADRQRHLIKVNYRAPWAWQKATMSLRRELLQIAAAAALFIVAWLAPSIASAHAGHRDGASAVVSSSHHVSSSHRMALVTKPSVDQVAASESIVSVMTVAFPVASGSSGCEPPHCSSGCPAVGAGCCAPALASEFDGVDLPTNLAALTVLPDGPAGLGATPDAVRRPPKSFV